MSVRSPELLLDWLVGPPARSAPDPASTTSADWDAIVSEAVAHTLAPQLLGRLVAASRDGSVPAAAVQAAFVASVRQKEAVAPILRDIPVVLGALAAAGIEALALKGAHLALAVYPEPAQRPMSDIDVLVRPGDLAAAEAALLSIGYTTERSQPIEVYESRNKHLPMLRRAAGPPVEIHWNIVEPQDRVPVEVDDLWERSVPATLGGAATRVLSPEDLLAYICLHAGVVHQFAEKGLRPLADVEAILRRQAAAFSWPAFERRVAEWGIGPCAYLMLDLARGCFGAAVPDEVLTRLRPARLSPKVREAAREQLYERPGGRVEMEPRPIALAVARPWMVLSHLFSRRSQSVEATPRARAKRLLTRYWSFLWRWLRRDPELLAVTSRTRRQIILSGWLARHGG